MLVIKGTQHCSQRVHQKDTCRIQIEPRALCGLEKVDISDLAVERAANPQKNHGSVESRQSAAVDEEEHTERIGKETQHPKWLPTKSVGETREEEGANEEANKVGGSDHPNLGAIPAFQSVLVDEVVMREAHLVVLGGAGLGLRADLTRAEEARELLQISYGVEYKASERILK